MAQVSVLKQTFSGSLYRKIFLYLGIALQLMAYFVMPGQNLLSLFSGITGIIAVVLCAEKKLAYYWFAWPQLISYLILAYNQKLYGEVYENVFYVVTMIIGMYIWFKHKDNINGIDEVKPKKLTGLQFSIIFGLMLIIIGILYFIFENYTDDTQPLLDSVTTVPAFIAQILLTFRYREQWVFWFIINVGSIFMWLNAGDYCMFAQYVFWAANAGLGWYMWSRKTQNKAV